MQLTIDELARIVIQSHPAELNAPAAAHAKMPSVDAILEELTARAEPGDTIALLSNGAFGGIHTKLLKQLA